MCLDVMLDRKLVLYENTLCYKLFKEDRGYLYPLIEGKQVKYNVDTLLKQEDFSLLTVHNYIQTEEPNQTYPFGFHAWVFEAVAQKELESRTKRDNGIHFVLRKVVLTKIVAIGFQECYGGMTASHCIVGQEMIILPE